MAPTSANAADRFALITAGHHFLMNALPLQEGDARAALGNFVAVLNRTQLPPADIDAILIRCLAILDRHSEIRIPSLVDRYVAKTFFRDFSVAQFKLCVEDLLTHHGIRDGFVQQAVEIIRNRYSEPTLAPRCIADMLGLRLPLLDVSFRRQMGRTLTEHIRAVRLDRAVVMLATTGKSIKEVWVDSGYNHHSNFDRDFKRRFGASPSKCRALSLRPMAQAHYQAQRSEAPGRHAVNDDVGEFKQSVLIVDDDECTRTTIGVYLRREGHRVWLAATGAEGLLRVKQRPPDTILVDYHLGDMDGLEFLRMLRRDFPGDVPRAAVFTADWDLFARTDQVNALNATIASKLCDLEQVGALIDLLSAPEPLPAT
jgi:CheY-like chemotaxis protein/AraC-like DNA-binding protein